MKTPAPKPLKFAGTTNPCELRTIRSLMTRLLPPEHRKRAVGCSSGPDLVLRLRQKSLGIYREKVQIFDREGA